MPERPTYEELERRVKELEQEKLEMLKGATEIEPGMIPDKVDLKSVIDIEEIQSIFDDFHYLTDMVTAVLDMNGNVIESTGWRDICTIFHRINPETARNCKESDLYLSKTLKPGDYIDYKCKNGLWDVVTPLYVGTEHLGNIYTGQFFYDDEEVDEDFFAKQAETYGFEKDSYLKALRKAPRYSRDTIHHLMSFLVKFTTYISKISIMNRQLAKEIKERKRIDRERARLNADLAAKNEELEQVVYVASHDLRSPLVNIDGYGRELTYAVDELRQVLTDTLAEDGFARVSQILDKDIPEALRFIRTSASKMDSLLSGLLRLSRSGRSTLKYELLDMNDLICKVIEVSEFQIKQAGIKVDMANLPPCRSDAVQMNQVFSNLLDNAIKYLDPNRPGIIRIFGRITGAHSEYCIQDNGMGIAKEHMSKIFEIFHRLDPTTGKGDGLGLTIVKRIMGRLAGTVRLESDPGSGSRFYISVPTEPSQTDQ